MITNWDNVVPWLEQGAPRYSTLPNDTIIGLGASAISELPQGLAQNNPSTHDYEKTVQSGVLPTMRGWLVQRKQMLISTTGGLTAKSLPGLPSNHSQ